MTTGNATINTIDATFDGIDCDDGSGIRLPILRMFFRESWLTLGLGISLGLLLAVLAGRGLTELLYEVGPQDAVAFITAPLILATRR